MRIGHRKSTRVSVRVGVGAAAVGLALGVLAPPALAEGSDELCPFSGALCLYSESGFEGERFTASPLPGDSGACVDLVEHGWGEAAQSAINTGSNPAAMFQSSDCTGHPMQIPTGSTPNLTFSPNSVYVQG
ncbi:peptidase inhibitor family I36 protein [Streptomonospora sp. PA3]|uniref:peptidase inhibitor family I36 protein n=1 Tax=Streptomonospora sp. PA3 TaxID=2607326 RepID=UPI001642B5BB|nr:peptidase inhibitor family I36 protein [Streptomonospora sp. PA3]